MRFLAPLAYLSPRIIDAIAEGRAPVDVTVTRLVRNLPAVCRTRTSNSGLPDPTNGRLRPSEAHRIHELTGDERILGAYLGGEESRRRDDFRRPAA